MATEKRPTMLRLPVNMQIEHALSKYIADYENQHGPIQLPESSGKE